ncbi:platelet-activating factor acetylhydrolase [Parasitella parasitica]|nr:platelet-activating factor acetylhydrolase [Parasitella parasitica]
MSLILANFPSLTGKFAVGCHDIEWKNRNPAVDNNKSLARSVLMRLYYPANIKKYDHKANWITDSQYAKALCDIAKLPAFLSNWLSGLASIKKTRFYKDAEILDDQKRPFPVVVFSHGLGGNRLIYSSICSDLASHGFVVVAIEHRDGSASLAKGIDDEWIQYDNVPPEIWGFRHHQLRHRVSEVDLCVAGLDEIAVKGLNEANAPQLKGKLDMKSLVMAGHSFGGATTMLVLNAKNCRFQCGVLLDPWAQPLMMMVDKQVQIKKPVIAILSEQFTFWPDNFESVKELIDSSTCSSQSICLTLNGTEHQHQSDVLLVLRYFTLFDFRSPFQIDPVRAIDLNTEAAVTFINKCITSTSFNSKKRRNTATASNANFGFTRVIKKSRLAA